MTVGTLLDKADTLLQHADAIKALNANAAGEANVKEALHQIALWGLQRSFALLLLDVTKNDSQQPMFVIKDWQELQIEVGDQQLMIRSMRDSPHSSSFKDDLLLWERRLAALQQSLQLLNGVQRKWIYLEPIFAKGALPFEQPRFNKVDEEFRRIMDSIATNPAVMSFMEIQELEETLVQMDSQLDICQQALFSFLEEKRSSFPRFYFVGDDDLLEILGQSENPRVIQTHLRKIFSGVQTVSFSEDCRRITAVESPEGEVLQLLSPVHVLDEVETWLNELHSELKLTLQGLLEDNLKQRRDGIQYPCQILSLAGQIKFTLSCEEALQVGALRSLHQELSRKLLTLTEYGGPDAALKRSSVKALVLDLIHAVDVVDRLEEEKASQTTDWAWSRQLRYYHTGKGSAEVKMAGAEFKYSFEYLGVLSRLVYTPLSDACYLVLSQGLRLGYGASISGPAGTGKTESVKALGHYLGRKVLVFNCDGDFDFKSMGRIFTGILKSGAWGCFDEFNRLEEDVLSVVSQQIQVIQVALREKVETIRFLGKIVRVDHDAAVFVTMNPRSNKYTGRSKLPDNLKSLFRSVTMTHPNSELIAEVNLISEGFRDAKEIGRKLIVVFSYAEEILSSQHHYDWGLRAVKVVLTMGGFLLEKELKNNPAVPPEVERSLIVHALFATTLPKLIISDCARFEQLVFDVFQQADKNDLEDHNLEQVIPQVLTGMKLQVLDSQVQKVMQLHLACRQRLGVSLVGPSGSGKTTVWRVLQAALASSNQPVKVHILNPKGLSRHQLLGHMDLDTQMWFDGVLTCLARKVAREPAEQKCWIVCDGDVDPEWIEALNSVLDDNRVLTLPSGERIQFGSNVNILFECEHLNFASPATVSRTSMIVFSNDLLTPTVLAETWLSSLGEDIKANAKRWVQDYLEKAMDWVTSHKCVLGISKVSMMKNVLSHLDDVKSGNEFLHGLTLGLGSLMEPIIRAKFHAALRDWFGSQTSVDDVVERITELCTVSLVAEGSKLFVPKDGKNLILFFRGINLLQLDRFKSNQLFSFLQQLISYHGFYDKQMDFVRLEMIQVVATLCLPTSDVGRYEITRRFTSILRLAYMSYPPRTELEGLRRYKLKEVDVLDALLHEAVCIFRDQLRTVEEVQIFDKLMAAEFRQQKDTCFSDRVFTSWLPSGMRECTFQPGQEKLLTPMEIDEFHRVVAESLATYQREVKNLPIILFPEFLQIIAKFDRVVSSPGGTLLLLGSQGVGRRSCLSLIAFMHSMELFSPSISRSYNLRSFEMDIKSVVQTAGIEGRPVVFFLEDYQLIDLSFLHVINSLLSGGGVSGLYSMDELQVLMAPLQELMAREGFTHHNMFSFFMSRVQANLHIVLSLNTRHPDHETRLQKCSTLMSKSTVLRIDSWSEKGLVQFLLAKLREALEPELESEAAKNLQQMMLLIHKSVLKSHVSVSSSQFVAFADEFTNIFSKKKSEMMNQMLHLQAGLSKLASGASQVEQLSQEAAVQEKLLVTKQRQAEESLQKITRSMEALTTNKAEVEKLKSGLYTEEAQLQCRKESIEDELRKVQPQVDAARKAVGQIRSDHLNEIRSLKIPPEAIRDVLEGVLRLMGNFDTSWLSMKKFLASRTVKEEIMNFDARKVKRELYLDVQKLLNRKPSSFDHATIYHVSVAAAPLAAWVKANVQYAVVLDQIRPLQEHIQELTKSLEASRTRIQQCEQDLEAVDMNVAALKAEFSSRTGEAEVVKLNLQKATAKVKSAMDLLAKLSGEKLRWENQVAELEKETGKLRFSSIMAAAFMTYLAPASEDYRNAMLSQWQSLSQGGFDIIKPLGGYPKSTSRPEPQPEPEAFSLTKFMSSESEILFWRTAGLTSNEMVTESAIAVKHSRKCRLLVDPLGQAVKWLINCATTQDIPFETVGLKDARFTTALQLAVRFGKMLIVQDVEEVEPVLFPLLRSEFERQNSKWTVRVGGKVVDLDENFQLYLIARESRLTVPPDTLSLLLQTNFTVTRTGLEKQLLSLTLHKERPDLEEQNNKLIQSEEKLRLQLMNLEKKVLEELSCSDGDILDNQTLIDSLNETKIKSTSISKSLKELASLQETLNARSRVFEPYAKLGSSIFILLQDLSILNPMYCFGLGLYFQLFEKALSLPRTEPKLQNLPPDKLQPGREEEIYIKSLCQQLTELIYYYVSRSLYKTDRLTFGMHMALNLALEGKPTEAELNYFLQQLAGNEMLMDMKVFSPERAGVPSWIPPSRARAYNYFKAHLPGLVHSLNMESTRSWTPWAQSKLCERELPEIAMSLTPFQRLVLIQALRPERLQSAMQLFVCSSLGIEDFYPPLVLENLLSEERHASVPVLFITPPGEDPSLELEDFAALKIGSQNYHQLAMGQGQAQEALKLLHESARTGSWVCFKNLHLVVSWLPQLEKELHRLNPHPNFRLWLTTEPNDQFPRNLLEQTLKITIEPPQGLKNKLQKTCEAWSPQLTPKTALEERMLFLLTILHAVVQERCSYIPQGWAKVHEFNLADLRFAADLLHRLLDDKAMVSKPVVPYLSHFRGLLTMVIYGGRLDNRVDKAVLEAYISQYFSEEVIEGSAHCSQLFDILQDSQTPGQISPCCSAETASVSGSFADYANHISRLQELDSPAVLGLPPNILRSQQERDAGSVITQLKVISSISLTAGEEDKRSHLKLHLSPLLQRYGSSVTSVLVKVRESLDSKQAMDREERLFPIVSFLQVELETAEKVLNTIQKTLSVISESLKPSVQHLPQRVLEDCRELVSGKVLDCWSDHWEGPDELSEYLKSVLQRASAISKYWDIRSTLQVESFKLSAFFKPRAFLRAVSQQAARNLRRTLDDVKMVTVWDPSLLLECSELTSITSLLQIEGATFDGQFLAKTVEEMPTLSIVPECTFAWVPSQTAPFYTSSISVPLYDTVARSQLVTEVRVPCSEEQKQEWLLAGVAFFLPLSVTS
ncbi:hypothetical protein R1sor_026848 [Riccia sorocarpa]|uniref:AAA+ ATPase domain-containing protein n=1 Tax=Riccia sorocarpa TaxID=122646 RepID=A0ABD3GFV6_9MARC